MNKIIISFLLLSIASCSTLNVPLEKSNISIKNQNTSIIKNNSYLFAYGSISNMNGYLYDANSVSIYPSDSVIFYKVKNNDTYFLYPNPLEIIDLSNEEIPNYLFYHKLAEVDESIFSEPIKNKISFYKYEFKKNPRDYPLVTRKSNYKFNYKELSNSGITNYSFKIIILPNKYSSSIIANAVHSIVEPIKEVTDIIYIESFPKNIEIKSVSFNYGLFGSNRTKLSSMTDLRWDYVETKESNYLILYYPQHKGYIYWQLVIDVNGIYKRL